MFDSIENAIKQATGGNIDPAQLASAVESHLGSLDDGELAGHLQTAAGNAQQQGQGDVARQIVGLVEQLHQNPDDARSAIVSFVRNNPQILQHFAPEFAQGVLSKFGA